MKIKITGKFFIWLAVLPLSLLPALLVNTAYGYLSFLTLLFFGLLSLLYLAALRGRITYEAAQGQNCCPRGETLDFTVQVRNKGLLPVARIETVFFSAGQNGLDSQSTSLHLTLKPREQRRFSFSVRFDHIGVYRAGIRNFTLYDLLGIFKLEMSGGREYRIEITPRVFPLERLPVSENASADSKYAQIQSSATGMDYTGVREYAFGDAIKNIHWKLSAHLNGLVTKQRENYSNTGITVVPDFRLPGFAPETRLALLDAVAEAAVSVGDYAYRNGMDYDLIYIGKNGEKVRLVPPSFRELPGVGDDWVPAETDHEDRGIERILREDCGAIYGHANIAVCLAYLSEQTVDALDALKRAGKTPMLFFALPDSVYDRERKALLRPLQRLEAAQIAYTVFTAPEKLR